MNEVLWIWPGSSANEQRERPYERTSMVLERVLERFDNFDAWSAEHGEHKMEDVVDREGKHEVEKRLRFPHGRERSRLPWPRYQAY